MTVYLIKLADGYLVNVMGDWLTLKNKKDGDIFTQSEIDELQKQEQFKAIDLNQCKEKLKMNQGFGYMIESLTN
jgi:hypothetical protein